MTQLDSGWKLGPGLPIYNQNPNYFGGVPHTSSGISGPLFDTTGKQVRNFLPAEGWMEFFGKPRKALERSPNDQLEEEMYDLPQAYTGKVPYITQILISRITDAETWILSEFAPWTKFEGAISVTWDIWAFSDHMLGKFYKILFNKQKQLN